MKNYLFLIFLFCQLNNVFSQETVKIVTYGSGKTYESALSIALRSSLEQAAGVFISNMAVVKNDSLIYDEVKSISNGTITKYDILAKVFDSANSIHTLTIEAEIVSEKFLSFVKSVNNSIEFNGNAFIRNIKLNRLYKENEPYVLSQFLSQYFYFIDSNYASLNSIYMEGWDKIYDKDVKVIGGDPFKYIYKPIEFNFFQLTGNSWQYDMTKSKFLGKNWFERRDINFQIADAIVRSNQKVLNIGDIQFSKIDRLDFVSRDFNFNGPEIFDSLFILHNTINYFNEKIDQSWWYRVDDPARDKIMGIKTPTFKGKTYKELTDYWYFRLHYWINKQYNELEKFNSNLKLQEGKFVFNLEPVLTPNENYRIFINQLERIVKSLSINRNDKFDESIYEKNNDKLYPIYFVDLNSQDKPKKYLVRNEKTYLIFKNIISQLHIFAAGGQLFGDKLLKTDKGDIKCYLTGRYANSNKPILSYNKNDYNAIVSNPIDQYTTVGVVNRDLRNGQLMLFAEIGLRFLITMSAFLNEEEMSQLNKFIIASKN
jgi:hypothetical protein